MDNNNIVQSFWYSKDKNKNSLSPIELLCVASFLYHNHHFHLYTYTPDDASMQYLKQQLYKHRNFHNLQIKDARKILSENEIFFDSKGSIGIAAFSDYFRYNLLYQKGGWWVDMDVICLKYLSFSTPFVFATERCLSNDTPLTATCVIKGEKQSDFLLNLITKAKESIKNNDYIRNKTFFEKILKALRLGRKMPVKTVNWGLIGPQFLHQNIQDTPMMNFVYPPSYFCEIDWFNAKNFIDPTFELKNTENLYTLHAWNAKWEENKQEKSLEYPQDSLIEKLKQQYLTPPPSQG